MRSNCVELETKMSSPTESPSLSVLAMRNNRFRAPFGSCLVTELNKGFLQLLLLLLLHQS